MSENDEKAVKPDREPLVHHASEGESPSPELQPERKRGRPSGQAPTKTRSDKGTRRHIKHSKHGIPQLERDGDNIKPPKIVEPPEDNVHLNREMQIGQVEILMLKGVTATSRIAATLGIMPKTAKKYKEVVEYRWAIDGRHRRMSDLRGEAKARLDYLTNELWVLFSNTDSESVKGGCLKSLLDVHDRRMVLDGLNANTINQVLESGGEDALNEESKMQANEENRKRMAGLATALLSFAERNSGDIEDAEISPASGG